MIRNRHYRETSSSSLFVYYPGKAKNVVAATIVRVLEALVVNLAMYRQCDFGAAENPKQEHH